MSDKILLIFEGDRTERLFLENLKQYFLDGGSHEIYTSYGTNIYQLYQAIKGYQDEPVDTVEVLLELLGRNQNNLANLTNISRKNIAQVYLFFDYDGHDTQAEDTKLEELLAHFDNETENGLLYISYPMVEALKHIPTNVPFESVCVDAKQNIRYKNLASQQCHPQLNQHGRYTKSQWCMALKAHCYKLNFITIRKYRWPEQHFSQQDIFKAQLKYYINPAEKVAVLSAFPVLLIDYYGHKALKQLIQDHQKN